jgi:hypothetical protein
MALIFVGVSPHTEVCHLTVKTRLCFQSPKAHPTRRGDWSRDQSLLAFGTLCSSQGSVSVACRVPLTGAVRASELASDGHRRARTACSAGTSIRPPLGRAGRGSVLPPRGSVKSVGRGPGVPCDGLPGARAPIAAGRCPVRRGTVTESFRRCQIGRSASVLLRSTASYSCGAGRRHLSATACNSNDTGPLSGNSCAHPGRSTHT